MVDINKTIDNSVIPEFVPADKTFYSSSFSKSNVNSVKMCYPISNNFFSGWIANTYISPGNGISRESYTSVATDFITINPNDYYKLSGLNPNLFTFVALYNADKEFLGRTAADSYSSLSLWFTQYPNTSFIRVTSYENPSVSGKINDIYDYNIYLVDSSNWDSTYESYDGCLYGLELYDMIETNFITSNYYLNCGIIALFLALILILVNAPFLFIRKLKGD